MATEATLDPSLLTAKKPKGELAGGFSPRRKRLFKVLAYVGFFLSALVFFTIIKIPDAAVANFLIAQAHQNAPNYQFQADKISVKFFPLPHLVAEKLSMEPRFPGSAIPFAFEELRVYPNPLVLGASFSGDAYKTTIKGSGSMGSLHVQTENLDLSRFTPLGELNLDLKGIVTSLAVSLSLHNQRLSTAEGEVSLKGKQMTFDPSPFTQQMGMAFPVLNLGDLELEGEAKNGQLRIEKGKIGAPGKDLELLIVPGSTITFSDVMMNTKYDITLHVKPSAAIEKSVPAFGLLGAMGTKRPDGFTSIKIAGSLVGPPQITKGN